MSCSNWSRVPVAGASYKVIEEARGGRSVLREGERGLGTTRSASTVPHALSVVSRISRLLSLVLLIDLALVKLVVLSSTVALFVLCSFCSLSASSLSPSCSLASFFPSRSSSSSSTLRFSLASSSSSSSFPFSTRSRPSLSPPPLRARQVLVDLSRTYLCSYWSIEGDRRCLSVRPVAAPPAAAAAAAVRSTHSNEPAPDPRRH